MRFKFSVFSFFKNFQPKKGFIFLIYEMSNSEDDKQTNIEEKEEKEEEEEQVKVNVKVKGRKRKPAASESDVQEQSEVNNDSVSGKEEDEEQNEEPSEVPESTKETKSKKKSKTTKVTNGSETNKKRKPAIKNPLSSGQHKIVLECAKEVYSHLKDFMLAQKELEASKKVVRPLTVGESKKFKRCVKDIEQSEDITDETKKYLLDLVQRDYDEKGVEFDLSRVSKLQEELEEIKESEHMQRNKDASESYTRTQTEARKAIMAANAKLKEAGIPKFMFVGKNEKEEEKKIEVKVPKDPNELEELVKNLEVNLNTNTFGSPLKAN